MLAINERTEGKFIFFSKFKWHNNRNRYTWICGKVLTFKAQYTPQSEAKKYEIFETLGRYTLSLRVFFADSQCCVYLQHKTFTKKKLDLFLNKWWTNSNYSGIYRLFAPRPYFYHLLKWDHRMSVEIFNIFLSMWQFLWKTFCNVHGCVNEISTKNFFDKIYNFAVNWPLFKQKISMEQTKIIQFKNIYFVTHVVSEHF